MRFASLVFAAAVAGAACATAPANDTALQQTASLMVSIGQHGEGMSADDINDLIVKSNGRTSSLEKDKGYARDALRLTDVASFIVDIAYDTELTRIAGLKTEADNANTAYADAEAEIVKLEADTTHLQGQQKDEHALVAVQNVFGEGGELREDRRAVKPEPRDAEKR